MESDVLISLIFRIGAHTDRPLLGACFPPQTPLQPAGGGAGHGSAGGGSLLPGPARTSLDSVRTSLCWEPRSWFWWRGRPRLLMADSGTRGADCRGTTLIQSQSTQLLCGFIPSQIHPGFGHFAEAVWAGRGHGLEIHQLKWLNSVHRPFKVNGEG